MRDACEFVVEIALFAATVVAGLMAVAKFAAWILGEPDNLSKRRLAGYRAGLEHEAWLRGWEAAQK